MLVEEHTLPLTTFYCGRKKYRCQLNNNQIFWDNAKPPYAQRVIPLKYVIGVQLNYPKAKTRGKISEDNHDGTTQFTIHYAERKKGSIWRPQFLILNHSDVAQISKWTTVLQNHLENNSNKPKRLLLFVNPYGGKRKALKVYEKKVKPLLRTSGIDVTVIVSQRQKQIRDIVIDQNLDKFDAIACVGGDGTVSEILNGLVLRECRLRNIDPNDRTQILPRPTVPVGIIPGGSTDATVYCLHGTSDVITAVLHIILGNTRGLDLVAVHDENKLLQIYADTVSYGYLGDIAYYSEDLRWMGPSRYEYVGFKKILSNRGYQGELTILEDETAIDGTKCYEDCHKCFTNGDEAENKPPGKDKWTTIQGKFFLVSGANISCAGERNPNGLAPYSHLGDGYLHLIVIRHTSLANNLKTLHRLTRSTYCIDDLAHVDVFRAKEFHFKADDIPGRWSCDGEVLHHTDIRAKVHWQLLTVFGRGMANPENVQKGCCGS